MKTLEELVADFAVEHKEFDRRKRLLEAQGRKVRRIRTKINKMKSTGILGEDPLCLEKIMQLEWWTVEGKLYDTISEWLYKNYKYLHQSGYWPDAGGQCAFTIKMHKDDDLEPQVEEIMEMIRLSKKQKDGTREWNIFVSSYAPYGDEDNTWRWRLKESKSGKIRIEQFRYDRNYFDSFEEALAWIRENLWYSRNGNDY